MSPTTGLQKFPCNGCGATLEFDPAAAGLKCPYCGSETATPAAPTDAIAERDFEAFVRAAEPTHLAPLAAVEVACPGCGARVAFEPPEVAGDCPFCGTGIVTQTEASSAVILPESLLPFKVERKQAHVLLQNWLKNLWWAPSSLSQLAQQEKMQGVYLPFWTYDCQTHSHYDGERGTHYYVTETYQARNSDGEMETKTRQVRKTRWHRCSGNISRFFDDILIPATTAVEGDRLGQLEPWDLENLVPYDAAYLAGFKAQRYQISLQEGFTTAKAAMDAQIRRDACRDIGGDEQRVRAVDTEYENRTFKHLLLPVWLCSYRFQNKRFQIAINARTGEVLGDRPYSAFKIALAVLAAVLVLGGVGLAVYINQTGSFPSLPGIERPRDR